MDSTDSPNASPSVGAPGWPSIWALVGLILAPLVWAQFRGLDLLDAATHFLTYQYPGDNPDTHTRYHLLARPIWLLCSGNIVAFRLACLALLSGAALVFWRAWAPTVAETTTRPWAALALWLSTLGGLAWLPVLLGYNSLGTFFALLAWAALAPLLDSCRASPRSQWRRLGWLGAFIAATIGAALAKPPAALAVLAWGSLLAVTLLPRAWRLAGAGLAALIAALGGWGLFRSLTVAGSVSDQLIDIGGVRLSPAWVVATLQRYLRELGPFFDRFAVDATFAAIPAFLLVALVTARLRGRTAANGRITATIICMTVTWLTAGVIRRLWDGSFATAVTGEMARLYLLLWLTLLPAWLAAVAGRLGSRRDVFVAALFFLPWTGGLGSTNTLYFSALHWTVFWTGGLLIVSRTLATALAAPQLHRVIVAFLILTGGLHLFSGHFLRPYMHQPPLWRQSVPTPVGNPVTVLRLDAATSHFLREIRTILDRNGYEVGEDLFGFFNLPGVAFAVGAKQPGAPWYFGTWYGGDDTDGAKLRAVDASRKARAWIVTQADVTPFRRQFHEAGIDFPDAYSKIGQSINPTTGLEIVIWKPKNRR